MPNANKLPSNNPILDGPTVQSPTEHCLECGKPISPATPHGVCAECSLRNLLNASFQQHSEFGSRPLIDHPDKDVTIDAHGQAILVKPLQPGDQIGPFQVVRRLGRGGMGTVYEAQDSENQRRIALKVLMRPVENEEARQRFLREGRLAASINHPNSVFVFGTHQIDRLSLISMELVDGGTLEQRVRKQGPLPSREAVDTTLQIIDGLDAAYARGVLHRDIKPANCFEADDGTIKIGDYGLSISTDADFDSRVTIEGTILGTPAFSSPEQLRGDALDVRSDIYALGVTLYYLLTGRTPYQADSMVKLLSQVFDSSPPTPVSLRRDVPLELSQRVMRCLAKEPGDRFRNYAELREALVPLSSQVPEPASLGWRTIAGLLDWCVLSLIALVYTAVTSYPSEQVLDFSYVAGRMSIILSMASYIAYFTMTESYSGRTVGKWLLGLQTINIRESTVGECPTFRQALLRATVFVLFPVMIVLPYNLLVEIGNPAYTGSFDAEFLRVAAVGLTYYALWIGMFSTARMRNGLAGLHELVSGTRVVSRIFESANRTESNIVSTMNASSAAAPSTALRIGPYEVLEPLMTVDGAEMHIAFDPVMLRRVWLRRDAEPLDDTVSTYRTGLSRVTRLRWLNRVHDQGRNWDAYEAPAGEPLVASLQTDATSSDRIHLWMGDLSRELTTALRDGTLPNPLLPEQLWLTETGRLKVLDFVAPGVTIGEQTGIEFKDQSPEQRCRRLLNSLAPQVRAALTPRDGATLPPSLYVTRLLSEWEIAPDVPRTLDSTRTVSARRIVSPRRRRLLMAAALYACPILVVAFTIAYQLLSSVFFARNDDIRELQALVQIVQQTEGCKDAGKYEQMIAEQPQLQATLGVHLETYREYQAAVQLIAGKHRGILDDPRMQSLPAMIHLYPPLREKIKDIQTGTPPSDAEVSAASEFLAGEIREQESRVDAGIFSGFSGAIMIAMFTWVNYTAVPAMLAGLLFRGGLVIHGFQTVIVRRDGQPAGRFRVFLRGLVSVAPGLVAILLLMQSSANLTGVSYTPVDPAYVVTAVVFAIGGAIVSNLIGLHSLADRIFGTAVVSR